MYVQKNNFIKNKIARGLNILWINKIDAVYCLLSDILALFSKSHFQRKRILESKAELLDNKQ